MKNEEEEVVHLFSRRGEKIIKFQQQKAVLQPFKPVDVYFSRLLIDEFKEI